MYLFYSLHFISPKQERPVTCGRTFELQVPIYDKFYFLKADFLLLSLEGKTEAIRKKKNNRNLSGLGVRAVHQQGQEFHQFKDL